MLRTRDQVEQAELNSKNLLKSNHYVILNSARVECVDLQYNTVFPRVLDGSAGLFVLTVITTLKFRADTSGRGEEERRQQPHSHNNTNFQSLL